MLVLDLVGVASTGLLVVLLVFCTPTEAVEVGVNLEVWRVTSGEILALVDLPVV